MTDAINSWNNVYSSIPDFKKYNEQFSLNNLNKLSGWAIVAWAGSFLGTLPHYNYKQPLSDSPLLFRVCLWSALGLTAVKGALSIGSYIQGKVWERTDAFAQLQKQLQKERSIWGIMAPPTDPAIVDCQKRHCEIRDKIWNSFPDTNSVYLAAYSSGYSSGTRFAPQVHPFPKPQPYTLEQLEADCEQWMNDSLAIAKAVREDLKTWSENNRFGLKGGVLLMKQPGLDNRKLHSSPWLFSGAFALPVAYRNIFDLPNYCESNFDSYLAFAKPSLQNFADNYPITNREMHNGWKEKFFTPGTKQYEWRQAYNREIEAILEQVGGEEQVPDNRFRNWARPHKDNDYYFYKKPDTLPT